MAKKKKKGSSRSRPKVPGTSQFARISSVVSLPSLVRDSLTPASSSEQGSSPPVLPAAPASPPQSPLPIAGSDLGIQSASVSSPAEISSPLTSGLPSAVEASTSGPADVAPSVASPGVTTVDLSQAKSPLGLDQRWTSLFGDSSKLEEIGSPSQHISGVPFVLIPDDNIAAAREEFKDFIFAQFQGNPPEMGRVIGVVNALWACSGPPIYVHNIGPGSFLLRVSNPRTRAILLGRNVWNIAGFPMFVSPWSPEFTPDSPPITSASITAEFRGVPYLLFNNESLSRIATTVGKPIALAPETERKENFEVAKVLARVDLTKDLPSKVISGFSDGREVEIDVSYPWLPPQCSECNAYGHDLVRCPSWKGNFSSLKRRSNRSRSRPRIRRRSRQGRSSERTLKTKANPSSSQLVWKVKQGPVLGQSAEDMSSQNQVEVSNEDLSVAEAEQGSANQILEWLAEGKFGLSTQGVVELTAHAESTISNGLPSSVLEEPIAEEQETPFILVTRRRSGRKVTLSH